nr:peptidoglycan DD-metalloendopeptidase family protein [uncultured Cohaesibacter sp.]
MDNLVLRKLLTTTSLLAMVATLAGCSGEVKRFGTPGTGYTSNQKEIFTSSVRSQPAVAPVYQPMPAAVEPVQVSSVQTTPVYQDPGYSAAPRYSAPETVPVVAQTSAPVTLTTSSVNRSSSRVPVQSYAMPEALPSNVQASGAPVYVDVPVRAAPDLYAASAPVDASVLNRPPVVISRFDSLPRTAPKQKAQVAYNRPSYVTVPSAVSVPVSSQVDVPRVNEQPSRFSIARLFSLPKTAPKSKGVDYTSTASIVPPSPIPTQGQYQGSYASQPQVQQPTARVAQTGARTSGQWTSVGGTMVTVDQGEDLQTLSRRYGVPAKAIAEVNGLADQSFVAPGQSVLIPVFHQSGYQNFANSQTPVNQAAQPMQLASISDQSVSLPFVMRVPRGNPLRMRGQSAYGQQIVKLQQQANSQNRHMVNPGETLGGIASRYGVSVSQLAQANNMSVNAPLRMGQRLHIPQKSSYAVAQNVGIDYTNTGSINSSASGVSGNAVPSYQSPAIAAMPKVKPRWVKEIAQTASANRSQSALARVPEKKAQKVASLSDAVGLPDENVAAQPASVQATPVVSVSSNSTNSADDTKFRWPVRGRIISSFGRDSSGVRNQGINLSVPIGANVRVAESGTVIYAGDDLKMYGNFIMVRHPNGWVTAYAHNEKLLVTKGQQVRRGQIIAQSGASGNVTSPQLHFELRIKGDPVDPVPYLI